ncbi:MAG: Ig domain-containing protein [Clostridiales bacterium]|nr:Ig domain-containing protein [Clostridiales bacterium]
MNKTAKRVLSVFLSVLLAFAALPVTAFAADGDTAPDYEYDLQIYCDGVRVDENGDSSETLLHVEENHQKQLTVKYKGEDSIPSGSHVVWSSPTPYLVYVDQNGVITGRDSSKGAIMRVWVAENIETLWLIGPGLADSIYDWMDKNDIDGMDAEGILDMMQMILGPILGEDSANGLYNSLMNTLNSMNVEIRAELVSDETGEVIAYNSTHVVCDKSNSATADLIPNGTYITNHNEIPATVEVGYEMDLQAITTPLRLNMGVNWEVTQKSWIADVASDIATVDENNHITFNKPGTVTIKATPSTQGLYDKLSSTIENAVNTGQSMGDAIGWMLENIFGMSVGADVIDLLLKVLDGMVQAGDSVENIIATISDWILKYSINDSVTVTVVDQINVTGFEIVGDTERLNTGGGTRQLTLANIEPAGAVVTLDEITWSSSNEDLAVIDNTGLMTIRGENANKMAWDEIPFEVSATINGVKVTRAASVMGGNDRWPTDLVVNGPSGMLQKGQNYMVDYAIYPSYMLDDGMLQDYNNIEVGLMIDGTVVYDDNISDGVLQISTSYIDTPRNAHTGQFSITPVGGGNTTLYVKTSSPSQENLIGSKYIVREIPITVYQEATGLTIDQGDSVEVELSERDLLLQYSGSTQLTATVTPDDATNKGVTWSSDNRKVSVDENGVASISGEYLTNPITATITATSQDDPALTDSITVTFLKAYVHASGVTLNASEVTMGGVGSTYKLTATVNPSDAANQAVTWESSDPSVVTVSDDGTLTAVAMGDATITVKTVDGGYTATCAVKVRADKTVLQAVLDRVAEADLNEDEFDLVSWADFEAALDTANSVNNNEFASQQIVDEAAAALETAFAALNAYEELTDASIVPLNSGDELSGEVIYHKTPWYQTWTSQTVELTVQVNDGAKIAKVEWQLANWSVDEPEGNIESVSGNNATIRPTSGVGPRSIWVQAVVTDVYGHSVTSDPVKVRFYNWDWQK